MRGKVFFNYRRSDSQQQTRRLVEHLRPRLPGTVLFIDDKLGGGADFIKELEGKASGSDAFICMIGRDWLNARSPSGQRRLDENHDFVRNEIFWALQRAIPVIPVLIDATPMPQASDLPGEIKLIAFKHALRLRESHYKTDAKLIAREIRSTIRQRRTSIGRRIATLATLPTLLALGAWAGPHVSVMMGIEPWVDIGVVKHYPRSNQFLREAGSHSFAQALIRAQSEVWFVGTTFYISVDENEANLLAKVRSGVTLNFIVIDPRSEALASSARALNTDANQLQEQCLSGLRVLARMRRRLTELGPEHAARLKVKLSRDKLQMRAYFFDPLSHLGTTYVVPQINYSSSQVLPGYLVRHDQRELPGAYFAGARHFWDSGQLVEFDAWLAENPDVR